VTTEEHDGGGAQRRSGQHDAVVPSSVAELGVVGGGCNSGCRRSSRGNDDGWQLGGAAGVGDKMMWRVAEPVTRSPKRTTRSQLRAAQKHCANEQQIVKPTFLVQPWGANLKMCSLYLSVFPEDRQRPTDLEVDIAEGFVQRERR
jgi:hypothetical protein